MATDIKLADAPASYDGPGFSATSFDKIIGLSGILSAYKAGCKNRFEMADHLNVTEEFLDKAIDYYKSKYGFFAKLDSYLIYFEPSFGVMEIF